MKSYRKRKFSPGCLSCDICCCNDDERLTRLLQIIQSQELRQKTADLSILVQALTKAELAVTLQGTGPFTVFAPTNAAFTTFLSAAGTSINDVPKAALTQIY
jgi:uncharacterized surface protein with fasciclin (FAS1) repeats